MNKIQLLSNEKTHFVKLLENEKSKIHFVKLLENEKCNIHFVKLLENEIRNKGYVYIVTSGSYNNKLKIGRTKIRNNVHEVRKYLCRRFHTTLGTIKVYSLRVFMSDNFVCDEKQIHYLLENYREKSTELFSIDLGKAIIVCKNVTKNNYI